MPSAHGNTTLYTEIPIWRESFNAGTVTFLVSQAKKAPNARRRPLYAYIMPSHTLGYEELQLI